MDLITKLATDIREAVTEKLAKRKKKQPIDYGRYAAQAGGAATGTIVASMFDDLKKVSVESIKERLYNIVRSAGSRVIK